MKVAASNTILLAVLGTLCCHLQKTTHGFAMSSSNTPSRKKVSNEKKSNNNKSGGFGKMEKKSVPIQHTADESESIQKLMNFLLSQKSTGFGSPDAGTEVGIRSIITADDDDNNNNNNNGRGVYATKAFKKNEIICRIPSDCALALCDPAMGGDDIPTSAHAGRNYLLFYQLDERASKLWAPYLDTLPSSMEGKNNNFEPTPDYFSDDEIEALEFPLAVEAAKTRRQQIIDLANSEDDSITLEDLQFATWLASSRSFAISISSQNPDAPQGLATESDKKSIRVLLPYLDLINHSSNDANAELHLIDPEEDEAWFAIRATRTIRAGKEITIAYGTGVESSVGLLQNYGFVPDENKIDQMMLSRAGDGTIKTIDEWSTTLEEDVNALKNENLTENMRKVIQLRCKLKRSYD
uniref:SET domain-containing protein n=1 Tax=Eucampia antarctica TaxID=49252 RepID=A0A7S2R7G0_9STRA|mmetsp:Transcript_18150/g.17528  ORF Transcript_18150/g.17528 Transcript_18150/m.17528 type:complete len:409 (+) Transcript_18150:102-1328(+)|eukprot:CAMPEP_0197835094 /NCGR_PEP_ID=MMETSP1437-20131217/24704_1 /TAXON_ID=49252 ORGANISM="Eucampia antarctica, Strain CCMP1452" /NCGR_SAMPLE_ID=MMETSP1437 /ASSEMBLY_ACC=CAM_ASM_001096 /LENGTH=408 /DNA_ID=CAMNT_0043440273 /DNA_START=71 /DNA_END=1297 /DNA_ORIENTATION=+